MKTINVVAAFIVDGDQISQPNVVTGIGKIIGCSPGEGLNTGRHPK